MNLLLSGPEHRQLREILLEAFDRRELALALRESDPSREFENLVTDSAFARQVFELIDLAEDEGWLGHLIDVLERERPSRTGLIEQARSIEKLAGERAEQLGGGAPTAILRSRFIKFAAVAIAIALVCAAAGMSAWALAREPGVWGLPAAAIALFVALAVLVVVMRPGLKPRAFLLSGAPRIVLFALGVLAAVNAWVLYASLGEARKPNFIVNVVESAAPLAGQAVHVRQVVQPGMNDLRADRTTNDIGQAYFRLSTEADRIYLGGVRLERGGRPRDCQFPAFRPGTLAGEITHDISDLGCIDSTAGPATPTGIEIERAQLRIAAANLPVAASGTEIEIRALASRVPVRMDVRPARAPLGLPSAPVVLDRIYYTLGYDPRLRAPRWVSFTVDKERAAGLRRPGAFEADPDLPEDVQPGPDDFKNNPYDRGHLVRYSDIVNNGAGFNAEQAAREAFYYSVIVPQPEKTNRQTWLAVEILTSDASGRIGPVHVVTGGVYPVSGESKDPFLVIGPGRTPVPIALFRVLLRSDPGGGWRTLAFLVPNDGSVERSAQAFITPISKIEAATGLQFFPEVSSREVRRLKSNTNVDWFLGR